MDDSMWKGQVDGRANSVVQLEVCAFAHINVGERLGDEPTWISVPTCTLAEAPFSITDEKGKTLDQPRMSSELVWCCLEVPVADVP